MIVYKGNVLKKLKKAGYSTYYLRKEKLFYERTIQQLREEKPVSFNVLSRICELLSCNVGDIIEYKKEESSNPDNSK